MKSVEMFRQEKENKKSEAASYLCVCVLRVVYFFRLGLQMSMCLVMFSSVLSYLIMFYFFCFFFFKNPCGLQEECYIFIQIMCAARIGTK